MAFLHQTRRRALIVALTMPLAFGACGYNSIQAYDETAAQAKQNIDAQLQRRADLIPNLVNTVKGFAAQEEKVLTEVTQARAGLVGALQKPGGSDPAELANANAQLTGALGRLTVAIEAYPELKSNENFLRLQDELTGTENRIAVSRTDYNNAVRQYNEYIRKFPAVLTAKATGAKAREYFEVTDAAARAVPTVDFEKR
ncbi:LemA family protein [Gemmatimonas sp.]|uniref:LemA family protein n=2 Tax=Gemmatimonas sp. TaxID=1962908 RepID=UPI0022CCC08C|nr:LemA family protein [Gemmatimonas sp.]MCE2955292.1 LemA family protein [Gemmatimonas sp.]MCZ8011908.1 LemA family protein [Gemmatimonas sp.]MCZ8265543.1 LemA family protein [Gemmatimonas sp.]